MLAKIAYVVVFSISAILCFSVAIRAKKLEDGSTKISIIALLISGGIWSLLIVAQITVQSKGAKLALYTVGLIFGLSTVFLWVYFTFEMSEWSIQNNNFVQYGSVILFVSLAAFKLTNSVHGLYFQPVYVEEPFYHLSPQTYLINDTVRLLSYFASAVGTYAIYQTFKKHNYNTFRINILAVILATPAVFEILSLYYEFVLPLPYQPVSLGVVSFGSVMFAERSISDIQKSGKSQLVGDISAPVIIRRDNEVIDINNAFSEIISDDYTLPCDIFDMPEIVHSVFNKDTGENIKINTASGLRIYQVTITSVELGSYEVGESAMLTDITEMKKTQKSLEYQRDQLTHLATSINHYLRNQTNVVRGHMDNTERLADMNDDAERALRQAQQANDKIVNIIEDLSKIADMSKLVDETVECDIRTNFEQAIEYTDSNFESVQITDGSVQADKQLLQQLFVNYLEYATEAEASVLCIEEEDGKLKLTDNGTEIHQEAVVSAFDHGEIISNGISLNVIRAIANSHKWNVSVQTDMNNRTMVFTEISS